MKNILMEINRIRLLEGTGNLQESDAPSGLRRRRGRDPISHQLVRRESEAEDSKGMMHLSKAYNRFCDLMSLAEGCFSSGDPASAVSLAQIAVRYAFPGHVGLFASPRLECLLREIGKQLPVPQVQDAGNRQKRSRHVLHVLTHAQPIGGDSRFAWRWMQEDRSSRHSIVITSQDELKGKYAIPEDLRRSAENTGGYLRMLDAPSTRPLAQASELRELCQAADIVVLHLYPYDIVPLLALAAGCDDVKTLFINHADHAFWVGASVAHSVVHLRRQQPDFLMKRRGLDLDRSSLLPVPLAVTLRSGDSVEAKRILGLDPDAVLLLTIATPFKYSGPGEIDFLDLVTPVLKEFPEAVLVAVGPESKGNWWSAGIQSGGRIVALGKRWDTDLLYDAADLYLDSVPFSSTTSLLEAGSRGIPLLGFRSKNPNLGLLGPGAPGMESAMQVTDDIESYRTMLRKLIRDAKFRSQVGRRIQQDILSLHTGSGWLHAVQDAYSKVEETTDRGCLLTDSDSFDANELNVALLHLYGHEPFGGLRRLMRRFMRHLPYRSRLNLSWHLWRKGLGVSLVNLVPPPADALAYGISSRIKKMLESYRRYRYETR